MRRSEALSGEDTPAPKDHSFRIGRRGRLRNQSAVFLELARSENFGAGRLAPALAEITEAAAEMLEVERVSVWLFNHDRSAMDCVDLYQRSLHRHSRGNRLAAEHYPYYFRALADNRTLAFHDARTDPRTREFWESYLEPLDIRSMLDVPIRVAGSLVGVVCHESVGSARRWYAIEQGFAASVGDFVALAIAASERRKAQDLLEEHNRHLERIVAGRTRELKDKNDELQRALEQLRSTQDQLLISEKLASLGSLVAGIAHEVNTPVGAIIAAADVSDRCLAKALDSLDDGGPAPSEGGVLQEYLDVLRENQRVIASAADRISSLVRSLRRFARLDEAEFQLADIHEGIESTLALIEHEWLSHVTVVRDYGEIPRIWCYPNLLNQVFFNLFMNASQAMHNGGTLKISTLQDGGRVSIRISDTGDGIHAEDLSRIFDPGFTTKGVGVGTGLGLSISYNIVRKHGGRLTVASELGRGSIFTVTLPPDAAGSRPPERVH